MLGDFIRLVLTQTPAATYRMLYSSGILEKHHYLEPHVYLEIVASARRGCGAALISLYRSTVVAPGCYRVLQKVTCGCCGQCGAFRRAPAECYGQSPGAAVPGP